MNECRQYASVATVIRGVFTPLSRRVNQQVAVVVVVIVGINAAAAAAEGKIIYTFIRGGGHGIFAPLGALHAEADLGTINFIGPIIWIYKLPGPFIGGGGGVESNGTLFVIYGGTKNS